MHIPRKDGALTDFWNHLNYESFETCEPCLMGKMTKNEIFDSPFTHTINNKQI